VLTVARRFGVSLMLAGTLAMAACGDDEEDETAAGGGGATTTEEPAEPVEVVYAQPTPPTLLFYPALVAEELGFFEEEGVEAKLAPSAEEIAATAFLDNGDADVSFADVDEILLARTKGGEHQSIFSPQHKNTAGIVTPADSGISTFEELEGKKVGLASEEDTTLFNAMVDSAGMEEGDIEHATVGTSGPLLAQLFEKGEIDAYVGNASDFTAMSANGVDLTNITPEDIGRIDGNPLAVLPDTLSEKEDAIVGFLRAWAKAQHLGWTKPEVVEAICREKVPAEWRNEASGEAAMAQSIELMTPDDPERIGDVRADVWETGQDVLFRAGIIEEKTDVAPALNDEYIEQINDFDRAEVEAAADAWMEENGA
jgi:NitT/TauT family transport system substrate-binding protein